MVWGDYNACLYNAFMRQVSCCFLVSCIALSSCVTKPVAVLETTFYVFRYDPPALVELSSGFQPTKTIPLSSPPECSLLNLFPSPKGSFIAMEFSCTFGQTVVLLDTDTGTLRQTFSASDSHFLAWTPDGQAVYLKVDSIANPRILRVDINGKQDFVPITELTYDLAPLPNVSDFVFTFTRGLGFGSELWLARNNGDVVQQLMADQASIISFARWSPDGRQIAFIKFPDSQTPYPLGELWVADADGTNPRFLAKADAGHGFAPVWSPDATHLAFVFRENADDVRAEQADSALASNIYMVDVKSGEVSTLTKLQNARVEAPVWSPDGNTLAVTAILDDKMNVYVVNAITGETKPVSSESACCAGWLQK